MKNANKCITALFAVMFIFTAVAVTAAEDRSTSSYAYTDDLVLGAGFEPVTDITGIPSTAAVGSLTLVGTVLPVTATNQTISWSVKSAGTTGASLSGNTLSTTAPGTATVTATIINGNVPATGWKEVSAGDGHTVAIANDGTLWSWGRNYNGQLGNGTTARSDVPIKIGSDADWATASAGYNYTVAIKTDGTLWAWGSNAIGEFGDGTLISSPIPKKIGSATWAAVSAGIAHTAAIRSDGTLWVWGSNRYGALGDGTITDSPSPVQVSGTWKMVSANNYFTMAIRNDNTLWAWGRNEYAMLGDGTTTDRSSPVQIAVGSTWTAVSAGYWRTSAIKTDGTLWVWGANDTGQLGDGTTIDRSSPVQIAIGSTWKSVSAGAEYTMAIRNDNTLWAWGWNDIGQLGDGTTTQRSSPVQIAVGSTWTAVSTGYWHTVAIKSDSTLWAWGCNDDGQLGDGTDGRVTNKTSPTETSRNYEKDFTITIGTPPSITTASLPDGIIDQAYSQTLTATGDATITWSIDSGGLPTGLGLSSAGVISGTPTASGTFNFDVKAENSIGDDTVSLSIFIAVPPTITYASPTLPDGLVGDSYSETLTATGDATITWSIDSGSLPAGLSLTASTGEISGTPTANGTFTIVVKAENGVGDDTMSLTLFVALAPTITYASTALPDGLVGTAYSETLTATGDTTIVWTIDSGSLPVGLSLSPAGVISGTPTANGTFNIVVKAENGAGDDTMSLTLFVALAPTITYASTALPDGLVGTAYSETLTATGDATIDWTIDSGALPVGLSLSPAGVISGTPTANGTFNIVVKAENGAGDDTMSLTLFVALAPTITYASTALPDGLVGAAYSETLTADGDATIVWTVDSGALPDGLALSPAGVISGTPTANGTFNFDVKAENSVGDDTMSLTLFVALAPTITYASATLPDGLVGAAYSETLTADGDATIVWTVDSGALPDGLTLSSDGIISGTPTANGTFSFVVKAENGVGDDTMSLSMFVALSPTITTASPLPRGILGLAYSETLTADGDATISWSIDSGDLPDGLTMSSDGIISGTPTVNGTFSFVVKAENSVGDDTMSISLFVALSPTIRSFSIALPEGTVGTEYELDLAADGDSTITWTLDSGALPDGLTLSPDGIISGTPTAKGVFDFVVRATNSAGTDTMAMTIKVNYKDNTLTVISVTVLSLLALLAVGFVVEGSGKGK